MGGFFESAKMTASLRWLIAQFFAVEKKTRNAEWKQVRKGVFLSGRTFNAIKGDSWRLAPFNLLELSLSPTSLLQAVSFFNTHRPVDRIARHSALFSFYRQQSWLMQSLNPPSRDAPRRGSLLLYIWIFCCVMLAADGRFGLATESSRKPYNYKA